MGTPHSRWREMHQSGRVGDHVADALLAPGREPADALDRLEGLLAEPALAVEGDEPLLGGAEDDRVLAAPADRVGVRLLAAGEERPLLLQEARRSRGSRRRPACPRSAPPRAGRSRPRPPGSRCRGRSARRSGSRPSRGRARCARRRCPCPGSRSRRAPPASRGRSRDGGNALPRAPRPSFRASGGSSRRALPSPGRRFGQRRRDQNNVLRPLDRVERVVRFRMKGKGEVGGKRPGSCRPDYRRDILPREPGMARLELSADRPRTAETSRLWKDSRGARRTRPPLPRAPCGRRCTSGPTSWPCRRGPSPRSRRAGARSWPGSRETW